MIVIKPLSEINFDDIHAAREEAFQGYVTTWTRTEYERMLHRRGYSPGLSFGAFDGDTLVSFTLNGIGVFNGLSTAYDTGTGTLKEYRGAGLATKIFMASLPHLRQAGVVQHILEVLQQNAKAISVYTNIGFSVSRELNYFIKNTSELP